MCPKNSLGPRERPKKKKRRRRDEAEKPKKKGTVLPESSEKPDDAEDSEYTSASESEPEECLSTAIQIEVCAYKFNFLPQRSESLKRFTKRLAYVLLS